MGLVPLSLPLAAVLLVVGVAVGRWFLVLIPLLALAGVHLLLTDDEWYSRVPELWQLWAYAGLTVASVSLLVGVVVGKLRHGGGGRSPVARQ